MKKEKVFFLPSRVESLCQKKGEGEKNYREESINSEFMLSLKLLTLQCVWCSFSSSHTEATNTQHARIHTQNGFSTFKLPSLLKHAKIFFHLFKQLVESCHANCCWTILFPSYSVIHSHLSTLFFATSMKGTVAHIKHWRKQKSYLLITEKYHCWGCVSIFLFFSFYFSSIAAAKHINV